MGDFLFLFLSIWCFRWSLCLLRCAFTWSVEVSFHNVINLELFSLIYFQNLKVWSLQGVPHFLYIPFQCFFFYFSYPYLFCLILLWVLIFCFLLDTVYLEIFLLSFQSELYWVIQFHLNFSLNLLLHFYTFLSSIIKCLGFINSISFMFVFLGITWIFILFKLIEIFLWVFFKL